MWMYDENDDDEYMTPEEQNAQYLRDNPDIERGMWREWVLVVCGWDKIDHPSPKEWELLYAKFYSGKAPINSVAELKKMRGLPG
jgi:hypothetical protein